MHSKEDVERIRKHNLAKSEVSNLHPRSKDSLPIKVVPLGRPHHNAIIAETLTTTAIELVRLRQKAEEGHPLDRDELRTLALLGKLANDTIKTQLEVDAYSREHVEGLSDEDLAGLVKEAEELLDSEG